MNTVGIDFFIRFGIQAIALLVLLRFTFFHYCRDRDSLFSFTLFGHGVFIVAALLHNVDISMGFAFGLFAVFSMLRYRTESISVRNMTYLFLVIVISLISSVGPLSLTELVIINTIICLLAWLCETRVLAVRHDVTTLTYGNMKNLKPKNRGRLLADLCNLTGLDIQAVEVVDRNYKNKTAKLRIFYPKPELNTLLLPEEQSTAEEMSVKTPAPQTQVDTTATTANTNSALTANMSG